MYTNCRGEMKLIVYADVLFLTNFVINLILLAVTSLLTHSKSKAYRRIIASCVGAVYAVCMFVPSFAPAASLLGKFTLSAVMTYISFGAKSIKAFVKNLCMFYTVSLVCGGCALVASYCTAGRIGQNNGVLYFDTSLRTVIVSSVAAYVIIKLSLGICKKYSSRDCHRMVIYKNGRAAAITVLLDTGNMLTEPLTGSPVIIVEKTALRGIVPQDIPPSDILEMSKYIDDIRLIPFRALGTDNGLLMGFKPDKICSDEPLCDNITIAISNQSLSQSSEYNALAGPESFLK